MHTKEYANQIKINSMMTEKKKLQSVISSCNVLLLRIEHTNHNEKRKGFLKAHTNAIKEKYTELLEKYHKCKHCGVMTTQPDEDCYMLL